MIVIDVNVLLAAHRSDHPHHADVSPWFVQATSGTERFTVPDFVWASFVRIATNRKVFTIPTPLDDVFAFVRAVRGQPAHITIAPAESHLDTFEELCRGGDANWRSRERRVPRRDRRGARRDVSFARP